MTPNTPQVYLQGQQAEFKFLSYGCDHTVKDQFNTVYPTTSVDGFEVVKFNVYKDITLTSTCNCYHTVTVYPCSDATISPAGPLTNVLRGTVKEFTLTFS